MLMLVTFCPPSVRAFILPLKSKNELISGSDIKYLRSAPQFLPDMIICDQPEDEDVTDCLEGNFHHTNHLKSGMQIYVI